MALFGAWEHCPPSPSKGKGPLRFENQYFTGREGDRNNGELASSWRSPTARLGKSPGTQPLPLAVRQLLEEHKQVCPLLNHDWDLSCFYRAGPALGPPSWLYTAPPSPFKETQVLDTQALLHLVSLNFGYWSRGKVSLSWAGPWRLNWQKTV